MGKKKRLQEIESLKLQVENLRKLNSEIKEKQFNDDFENVVKTLEKYGHLEWKIDFERSGYCDEIRRKKYTLVFNR